MELCEICRIRPAEYQILLTRNGRQTSLNVCGVDYAEMQRANSAGLFSDSESLENYSSQRESRDVNSLLSDKAQEVLQRAGQFAVQHNHPSIDTEDLLYSLSDDDVASHILDQTGIKAKDIKGYIEANVENGPTKISGDQITITPRVKSVLELAMNAANTMDHSYVGPEHLLIGVAEETDGMGGDILRKYGIKPETLRQQTMKVVGKGAKSGAVDKKSNTPTLDKYSRDLTEMATAGKLDPVIGRQSEIETVIEILARRTKNNPALIGEPGVGKTAIVEGLAQRIISNKVPDILRDKRVVELNLVSLVAGAKYKGEFEERLKGVLDEIQEHKNELVIFLDELHTAVGAGGGGGEDSTMDVSNAIKPALARGDLNLIGATTLKEYQKYIEKDSALERRFQPVFVKEPTKSQAIEILRGLRDKYEAHHRITITDDAIVSAVELSSRYITNRFLPDKAIDLLDQASARARVKSDTYSQELSEADEEINRKQREYDSAHNRKEYDEAKKIKAELEKLKENRNKLNEKWRRERSISTNEVNSDDIASVVSTLTGIPVKSLTQEEKAKLLEMEKEIHGRVIGQEHAVEAVSDAVRVSRAGLSKQNRPIASFIFMGPTGVGKTELAKGLAWSVFGSEDAMVRIDMSEYMEKHAIARLIGSPPGYIGYDEGGQLTEKVRRRPYSVILFDELEKAHPDVQNILLQILDDGRLTDGKGRVVDFSNTIIIATSNLGAHEINETLEKNPEATTKELREVVDPALRSHFRPEFINRWDEVIVFRPLNNEELENIVRLQLASVRQMALGQNIDLIFTDEAVKWFARNGYKPEYGARELKREIRYELENKLAKSLLNGDIKEGSIVEVDVKNDTIVFNQEKLKTKAAKKSKAKK
ncbi:ATP-dependent Clp protease ATP-binding subunit [Candidatus Saccharibacteria bacterium]|nr:ATP-dependent Clp protease ATP-binding subunit [Candidatus Saccharibacteria bacterium]